MGCQTIPYRRLPHAPKLSLHYLDSFPRVAPFYAHPPTVQSIAGVAKQLEFPMQRRKEVTDILRQQNEKLGAGGSVARNLERLEKDAVAVVTGQQVGLFGGPPYAIYKALSAVQFATELTRSGLNAVPVFWMASEDHDVDEVRHSTWFHDGKLQRFELPPGEQASRPVGKIALGAQVEGLVRAAAGLLQGPDGENLGNLLSECYQAGETYSSAFGKLMARLFAEYGLILFDPLDARLHRLATPIYKQALEDRDALNDKLLSRNKELERAGFAAQVKVTSRSTLLFHMKNGSRQVVSARNGEFQSGDETWPRNEFLRLAESEPEHLSPNALLRPVVQDYLLPSVAYLGGPSEIAYFAQSEVIYRHMMGCGLLNRMPVILPRADFTILDPKAIRLLKTYALTAEEIWRGPQEVRKLMERASLPKPVAREFAKHEKQLARALGQLEKRIAKLDPTLKGAVATTRRKMSFQLEKLRRKAGRALDKKAGLVREHEEFLESLIYPGKELQSRELCLLPFIARHGAGGLRELQKFCGAKSIGQHKIVCIS